MDQVRRAVRRIMNVHRCGQVDNEPDDVENYDINDLTNPRDFLKSVKNSKSSTVIRLQPMSTTNTMTTPVFVKQITAPTGIPFELEPAWDPTPSDVRLLKQTWPEEDWAVQRAIAVDIFSIVFDHDPIDGRRLFPKLNKGAVNHWQSIPNGGAELCTHARNFMLVLSNTVAHLHQPKNVHRYLLDLGVAHFRYVSRGFRQRHWELFADAVHRSVCRAFATKLMLPARIQRQLRVLWRHLSVYIARTMYVGFSGAIEAYTACQSFKNMSAGFKNMKRSRSSDIGRML